MSGHTRSSSDHMQRRSSGHQRRALTSLSTNFAATRVSKPDENKRRRHDQPREPGQENDGALYGHYPVSKPNNDLIRVDLASNDSHIGTELTDSDSSTHSIYSDALSEKDQPSLAKAVAGAEHNNARYGNNSAQRVPLQNVPLENVENAPLDNRYTDENDKTSHYTEMDEEDEDDFEIETTSSQGPQEPRWTKQIFNELQHVMAKHSSATLDENDEDTYDVTMVAEYAPEIFNYLHELEHKLSPEPNYMANQDELKWEMRAVLIDWVVQVHQRFNLLPETLFLTVNYIDRFLSRRRVSLSRFQLVGAVALFIAAKYEEINCPTVQEVAYMADNAYSIEDFLKAESFMIDVLEFDMGWPGPMSFLRRTSKADDYDYETRTLAKYFLEISIMDHRFVASQPSWLAAGAHYLSRKMLNKGAWTELHVFYSGYTEEQLKPLARIYMEICSSAETHHKAIFEKYQERKYRRSSLFVQEFLQAMRAAKD